MPLLNIVTNRADADPRKIDTLLHEASRTVAELLGKPERYVMVGFEPNPHLIFAGSAEPCAYLELKSIGLPASETARYSATLCDIVQRHLGIAPQRIYIEFARAEGAMWGWNSGTF